MIKHNYLIFTAAFLVLFLQACTVTFVQPYDEKLVERTEAFYKTTALAIETARVNSPNTRKLNNGEEPSSNSGHLSKYENTYAKLKIDANSLIIRALVNSEKVDAIAVDAHDEINKLISESIPSNCAGSNAEISGQITLTVQNYLDLKCLITHWEVQHKQAPNEILTRHNWEARQRPLMQMIVDIQKSESFKKVAQVN